MSIQIISIEGNIGSGKSTVVNNLKSFYKFENNNSIYFLEEPVNEWTEIKDNNGINIIEKFYSDQESYSFSFQMMAYISRLAMLKKAIKYCTENNIKIIVCERSLQTDKYVFCKMLYDSGKIEEINYKIYNKWFDEFIIEFPPIYYIYINTEPVTAFNRIIQRNRLGEKISLKYLQDCNDYHNNWLNNSNSIKIDGSKSINDIFVVCKELIEKLSVVNNLILINKQIT